MKLLKYYYNKNLVKKYLNNTIPTPKEMPQLSLQRSMNTLQHKRKNYGENFIPSKITVNIRFPQRKSWIWKSLLPCATVYAPLLICECGRLAYNIGHSRYDITVIRRGEFSLERETNFSCYFSPYSLLDKVAFLLFSCHIDVP